MSGLNTWDATTLKKERQWQAAQHSSRVTMFRTNGPSPSSATASGTSGDEFLNLINFLSADLWQFGASSWRSQQQPVGDYVAFGASPTPYTDPPMESDGMPWVALSVVQNQHLCYLPVHCLDVHFAELQGIANWKHGERGPQPAIYTSLMTPWFQICKDTGHAVRRSLALHPQHCELVSLAPEIVGIDWVEWWSDFSSDFLVSMEKRMVPTDLSIGTVFALKVNACKVPTDFIKHWANWATLKGATLEKFINALEKPAAENMASEHMPKAELKGMLEATRVERGNNYATNDGAAKGNKSDKDKFPSRSTPEDLEAMFDNFIEQVKAGGVDGIELDDCHTLEFTIKQLEDGDWRLRLLVHASAGTGKCFRLATMMHWLLHEGVRHINPEV